MRFFLPPLEIGDDEGFRPDKDIFGRKAVGDGLTNLLRASSDPLVLAVNGQWGSGKSVFLKMWAGALRNAGYPVVYFDAFEHDYLGDAFTAIAGEIIELEKRNGHGDGEFRKKALSVGKVLLRTGLVCATKIATAGLLSTSDIENGVGEAKDAAGDAADKLLEKALTSRDEERLTMKAFRDALGELPKLLGKEERDEQGEIKPPKPLIFIIDELDRCRPTFALEVLERIKHFFSVPNVHFVLGVNIEQLENSIKAAYGGGIDARTYLQKFIALTVELGAQPGLDPGVDNSAKFLAYLEEKMEFDPKNRYLTQCFRVSVSSYAQKRGLSFRHLERVMSLLAIALAYTNDKVASNQIDGYRSIIAGLCLIKVISPDLFQRAKEGRLEYADVEKLFDFHAENSKDSANAWQWFNDMWRYCLDENVAPEISARYRDAEFTFGFGKPGDIVRFTANRIIDRFVMER
jgi:hypothetical protein